MIYHFTFLDRTRQRGAQRLGLRRLAAGAGIERRVCFGGAGISFMLTVPREWRCGRSYGRTRRRRRESCALCAFMRGAGVPEVHGTRAHLSSVAGRAGQGGGTCDMYRWPPVRLTGIAGGVQVLPAPALGRRLQ